MLSRFFIDRPVFATVVSAVIVLVGLVAWGPPAGGAPPPAGGGAAGGGAATPG